MSQPYVGEIRCFGFIFAPRDWAFCNGQIIAIQQNSALFAILGTTYGGNGQTTFALPNLQGQVPMHWGTGPAGFNTVIGEEQGTASTTLLLPELPQHSHQIEAADPAAAANRSAAPMPWSAEQKRAFLAGQFNIQRHHYRTYIADADYQVLEHNGAGAGPLYLNMRQTHLHIVDIALMPAWRGKGLGTAILTALQETGRARGIAVGIFVEKFNLALRLYRRLGFTEIADHDVYLGMEWSPNAPAQLNVA